MAASAPVVQDNTQRHRFETHQDGHVAFAEYTLEPGVITFTHTLVPPELEGRGLASALAVAALASARARGLKVVPQCPFFAGYIQRHPEVQDLLMV
jgi:predicted GNAT family acetyltransferase